MEGFDYKKFVKNLDDHELLLIIAEEFMPTQIITLLLANKTQYIEIYRKVTGEDSLSKNTLLQFVLNEKLESLSLEDLLELLCTTIPTKMLRNELLKLDKKTQNRIMYRKIDDTINAILNKIGELAERVCEFPNEFNEINDLGEMIELVDLTIESEGETDELKQSKLALIKKIGKSVMNTIDEYYGNRFQVSNNGMDYRNELPNINIHPVHAHTVVFDFYADRKDNYVKFKDDELSEGSHFFLIWLNNIVGFPESERFIYLNGKIEEEIIDIQPFMNQLYTFEIYDRNENQLIGCINNEGDVIVKPEYSEFIKLSRGYFKAYRINPDEKLNDLGELISEKWVLITENGELTEFECRDILSVDEENGFITVLYNDNNEINLPIK